MRVVFLTNRRRQALEREILLQVTIGKFLNEQVWPNQPPQLRKERLRQCIRAALNNAFSRHRALAPDIPAPLNEDS